MTAPLKHPLAAAPVGAPAGEHVSDARLARALKNLAQAMDAMSPDRAARAMPIFDRLEAEYDAREQKKERFRRFLDG